MNTVFPSISLFAAVAIGLATSTAAASENAEFFEKKVRPLFVARCISCHGPDKAKGGLRLDTRDGWQRGGDSGPPIVPGEPEKSLLIQAVQRTGELKMPPREKLKDAEVAALVQWVKDGAMDPRTSGSAKIGGTTV